jgi:CAAX protease family protein
MNPPPSPWDPPDDGAIHRDDTPLDVPLVEEAGSDEPALEACWRCGKSVDMSLGVCPICRAPSRSAQPRRTYPRYTRPAVEPAGDLAGIVPRGIKAVLWTFAIMLFVSVIQAWWLRDGSGIGRLPAQEQQRVLLQQLLVFELVDTILLLIAVVWATRPPSFPQNARRYASAWLAAGPVLAVLLGFNWAYHQMILEIIGRQPFIELIELDIRSNPALIIFAICVYPAIAEELFFRYLALSHLRTVMGVHGAVWVSSVMFGMAHIHVPLSIPILIVVGVGLGYMRVWSGGLAIPMVMHGLHNAAVLLLESKL